MLVVAVTSLSLFSIKKCAKTRISKKKSRKNLLAAKPPDVDKYFFKFSPIFFLTVCITDYCKQFMCFTISLNWLYKKSKSSTTWQMHKLSRRPWQSLTEHQGAQFGNRWRSRYKFCPSSGLLLSAPLALLPTS